MDELLVEIKQFIQFGVKKEDYDQAVEFAEKCVGDAGIMRVLYRYYSELPEATEQPVVRIETLFCRQGVTLYLVMSPVQSHFYLLSTDHVLWLGLSDQEIERDVLNYFDLDSQKSLQNRVAEVQSENTTVDGSSALRSVCPACGVAEGDVHLLGCVVEVCPWCDGQLYQCNCRFDQLGVKEITTEEELDQLEELLDAKGRIPFTEDHGPAYPGTSEGLDIE